MDPATLPHAVAAGAAVAAGCGLQVNNVAVVSDSNRIALHLRPCDVLARVAPRSQRSGTELELKLVQRLAVDGAPVAPLDPRVEPRVYEQNGFAVTLWTYCDAVPPHEIAPDEYASALERLHAGMRRSEGTVDSAPHFTDRVDEAQCLVDDASSPPWIVSADRDLVATTLRRMRSSISARGAPEQLLHGEPHPGNVLRSTDGLLFVDFETCCRGPVEFDIAHATITTGAAPMDVAAHYDGCDPLLVRECWILMLAMVTAWRCDDLPNGRALATDWLRQLRGALQS